MGIQIGIPRLNGCPPTIDKEPDVPRPSGKSATGRLVVYELGGSFVEHSHARALGPQAVVDVVEIDAERLVESGETLEHVAAGGQTARR